MAVSFLTGGDMYADTDSLFSLVYTDDDIKMINKLLSERASIAEKIVIKGEEKVLAEVINHFNVRCGCEKQSEKNSES